MSELVDGQHVGRFVVLRDLDGRLHAVSANSVQALCESDDGSTVLLAGSRMISVAEPVSTVLWWLDGRGPGRPSD